jgi:hypothetical protein
MTLERQREAYCVYRPGVCDIDERKRSREKNTIATRSHYVTWYILTLRSWRIENGGLEKYSGRQNLDVKAHLGGRSLTHIITNVAKAILASGHASLVSTKPAP